MEGDIEGLPGTFRERPEDRILTLEAPVASVLSGEALAEIARTLEGILRPLGASTMAACVTCDQETTGEGGNIRLQSAVHGMEAPLQELAADAAGVFSDMSGLGSPSWHLSTPPSMREAWRRNGTIKA